LKEIPAMLQRILSPSIAALIVLFAVSAGGIQSSHEEERASVLNSPPDGNTAVRFFYQPQAEYFHYPLVFRPVEEGDRRLNTAPMREEGRTAYISFTEMRDLIQRVAHARLAWQESQTVEALGSCKKLARAGFGLDTMDIFLSSPKGTARTKIAPKAICSTLEPLDTAIKTRRALWELQGFRLNYGCKVPGFKHDAYPDH
jgi:hypothetical protein